MRNRNRFFRSNTKVLFLFFIIGMVAWACSKFKKTRNLLEGMWQYTRYEKYSVNSNGVVTLDSSRTDNLGLFTTRPTEDTVGKFAYTSDVFLSPSGFFRLSRDGQRIFFPSFGQLFYIKEIKSDRLQLIRQEGTPIDSVMYEERYFFKK